MLARGRVVARGLQRAANHDVARQPAVDHVGSNGLHARGRVIARGGDVHVQRRLRRPMAGLARNVERVAGKRGRGQRRQRGARDGHDGGRLGATRHLGVGQAAPARVVGRAGRLVGPEQALVVAVLEHVMHAPQLPHALRKVRVEVAVKDRVARREVAVARAAELDAVAEGGAGRDGLRVEIGRVRVARVQHPLVRVQVEHMRFLRPRVQVAKAHGVAQVAVVHVGRVVLVARADRRPLWLVLVPLQHQRRIAVGPGAEEELLGAALGAVLGHAHLALQRCGHHGRAHAGGAVVDAHAVFQVVQRVVGVVQLGKGLLGVNLVMQDGGELAKRRPAAVAEHVLAGVLAGCGVAAAAGALGRHDDGVQVAVHDALAVEHVQHRARGAAADVAPGLVVDGAVGVLPGLNGGRDAQQLVMADLRSVPARPLRFHVHGGKQAQADLPAVAFAAHRRGGGIGEVGALLHRAPAGDDLLPRLGQRAQEAIAHRLRRERVEHHALLRRQADVAAVAAASGVQRALQGAQRRQLQARDVQRSGARARLVHADLAGAHERARRGLAGAGLDVRGQAPAHARGQAALFFPLRIEQVLEHHLQAVAFVDTQHQRARALVGPQHGVAGAQRARGIERHHVVAQRVQHAGGHEGRMAVEHIGLLDGDHVGVDDAAARAVGRFDTRGGVDASNRDHRGKHSHGPTPRPSSHANTTGCPTAVLACSHGSRVPLKTARRLRHGCLLSTSTRRTRTPWQPWADHRRDASSDPRSLTRYLKFSLLRRGHTKHVKCFGLRLACAWFSLLHRGLRAGQSETDTLPASGFRSGPRALLAAVSGAVRARRATQSAANSVGRPCRLNRCSRRSPRAETRWRARPLQRACRRRRATGRSRPRADRAGPCPAARAPR